VTPRYSIVTITKNHAAGLRSTLESVASQTCRDFELIVIDGHSVDGTADVIRAFGGLVSRFELDRSRGIYSAMNQGVEAATGEWTLFLNAGDCFSDPEVLASVELPDAADFLVGHSRYPHQDHWNVYPPLEDAWKGMFVCHQATFCRTSRTKELRFDTSFQIAGDYEFFSRALKQGLGFSYLDRLISVLEWGGVGVSKPGRVLWENRRVSRRHFGALRAEFNFLRRCWSWLRTRIPFRIRRALRNLFRRPTD